MTGFDDPRGRESEQLAFEAEQATRAGRLDDGCALFVKAAELETAVARDVPRSEARVRGALAVSAVALWYKARAYAEAEAVACDFLTQGDQLDNEARQQLRDLLERCWREREAQAFVGVGGTFEPVEIKLDGGEVRSGVAPASAVRERQAVAATLLVRTAEWRARKPFRVRGEASRDISRTLRILEAPAVPGSYALRLYLASGEQPHLPDLEALTPRVVVEDFLAIAAAARDDDGGLDELVPDPDYRAAFLVGLRDLAPDGRRVGTVTLAHPVWNAPKPRAVFEPRHREVLSRRLGSSRGGEQTDRVEGVLKAVNLKAQSPSIDVVMSGGRAEHIRIDGKRFEDTLGPMLNRLVRVELERRRMSRGVELHAVDIALVDEADEWPWEIAARNGVAEALAAAEWREAEGIVVLFSEDQRGDSIAVPYRDLEDLRAALGEIATEAWYSSVPREGGSAAFEADTVDIVEDALEACADHLAALGWL